MKIRRFDRGDTPKLISLFRDTIRRVCQRDYNPQQILAWAPDEINESGWTQRFLTTFTLIAEANRTIVGFANLETTGNIDMLYVHADFQREGVAKSLYEEIESQAKIMKLKQLTSDVSITAKPFFIKMGFKIDKKYIKEVHGCIFKNTLMSKSLS